MTEYLIVGGGVYGAATAWELARRGAEVRLLEARTIASAASGGPGRRGVRANMRDRRELPLMALAYERWPSLHEELECPVTYERVGSLTLIERNQDLEGAAARIWLQNRLGIDSRLVERDELRAMEPAVGAHVRAAIHCPHDGVSRHADTTRHFAEAARRAGARLDEHTALAGIEMNGSRVTAVTTDSGERVEVSRGCLLLANSAVAPLLQAACELTLPVWNTALQVVVIAPEHPLRIHHLIGHRSRTLAVKAEPAGRVMVSGGYRGVWHAGEGRGEALPEAVEANVAQAAAVFPGLAGATVVGTDAGHLEAMSVDDVPIIDRLDPASNLFYATGWSGHGWAIAPAVSRLLADWASSGRQPDLLKPFSFERFTDPNTSTPGPA